MSQSPSRYQIERVTLATIAADNRIFVCRCSLCRKTDNYMATDLLAVYGADRPAWNLFTRCSHCGKPDYFSVKTRFPTDDDVGHLRIMRPDGVRRVQLWKECWFG